MKDLEFDTKESLFSHLRENKEIYAHAKKSTIKHADATALHYLEVGNNIVKANIDPEAINMDKFNISVVINTTSLMDSHNDVHIKGLWRKSLSETKSLYLLQEHDMSFKSIIAADVKAYTKELQWKDLGEKYDGTTEALIFDAEVDKGRNAYMAEQYAKGYVMNHSVGMRYVKIALAMNSDNPMDADERKVWNKYIDQVANRQLAEDKGYFWAVTEAKIIEGSAVPIGSNTATPTISVGKEPSSDTLKEPPLGTHNAAIDWTKIINEIKKQKL